MATATAIEPTTDESAFEPIDKAELRRILGITEMQARRLIGLGILVTRRIPGLRPQYDRRQVEEMARRIDRPKAGV